MGPGTGRPPSGLRLGRPERVTAAALLYDLAGYPHGAGVEVDVWRAECGEFGPAETSQCCAAFDRRSVRRGSRVPPLVPHGAWNHSVNVTSDSRWGDAGREGRHLAALPSRRASQAESYIAPGVPGHRVREFGSSVRRRARSRASREAR